MLPQGKDFTIFQDEFIKAILINILPRKREVQVSSLVKNYFPGVANKKVRKILSEFAEYVKISSEWVRNDNLDLKAIFDKLNIIPEKICSYQSMLVGLWLHNQSGVNLLKSATRLYVQIKKLNGEMTKLIAERIESELLKTPWGKISKIREAHKTGTDIDGQNLSNKQNKPNKETEKNKIGGTVADLRTVPLSRLKQILLEFNTPEDQIDTLSRWQMVGVVKELANRRSDQNAKISRLYARGYRNKNQEALETYKKRYQEAFDNNLSEISKTVKTSKSLEVNSNEIADDLESLLEFADINEEEEDELNSNQTNKNETGFHSTGDPKELIPYGVCTYLTNINWKEYGFGNLPMRKACKYIHISLNETGVDVKVEWKHDLDQNVFIDLGSTFQYPYDYIILNDRKKKIKEKLRRRKNPKPGTKIPKCLGYVPSHTFILFHEENKQLNFVISPEFAEQINAAHNQFEEYLRVHPQTSVKISNSRSSHSSHKKEKHKNTSKGTKDKKRQKTPQESLNNYFYHVIKKCFINFEGYNETKPNPNTPSISNLRAKCKAKDYKKKSDFLEDIHKLSDFYKTDKYKEAYNKAQIFFKSSRCKARFYESKIKKNGVISL